MCDLRKEDGSLVDHGEFMEVLKRNQKDKIRFLKSALEEYIRVKEVATNNQIRSLKAELDQARHELNLAARELMSRAQA